MNSWMRIPLSRGKFAIVDATDFVWLNQWKWTAMKKGSRSKGFYAYRQAGADKRASILMHRLVLSTPAGLDTDHKDNDGLNNRRSNLRALERTQNNYSTGLMANNTSGVRGVAWSKSAKLWRAYIGVSKSRVELGYFQTFDCAVEARRNAEKETIQLL